MNFVINYAVDIFIGYLIYTILHAVQVLEIQQGTRLNPCPPWSLHSSLEGT